MVYASREATRKAIRAMLTRNAPKVAVSTRSKSLNTSCDCSELPKKNEKMGIHPKAFKNANGAELIYK